MPTIFSGLGPDTYKPHALHQPERMWPETNCYVDLWIETLHAFGSEPEAMLGFTLMQDFEGDQFTFFKVPLEDLEALYGIRSTELAIYDRVETHVAEQLRRGRLCLVEMDSFYMPDTHGVGYHGEHGKTTVAINRLDVAGRSIDYFHNAGFFRLEGDDFDGLFHMKDGPEELPFLPYTEFVKFPAQQPTPGHLRSEAERLAKQHFARRPTDNPVAAFAKLFPSQVEKVAERPFDFFHKYAFNTLRQLGANFELAASHLDWLRPDGSLVEAAGHARRISEVAKATQFQVARAVARRKFEPLATALDPAAEAWDALMRDLAGRLD
ncbi:serine--tRNA ligase [Mesorhizobium hungaricum]|uniref:Serine--tRNA ligase n=1 Tax=Mesorhizobium hungaricum TaxID=1566387 RepID=A0A1C2DGR9_9HYPH|nr:serine--tRNA ligase [Mesorhizobium hungaricum]